jgi:UDP-galactopyranose mutase
MKKYDYLIVRAGFFGSVFASEARRRGFRCLLVERRNHIGCNAFAVVNNETKAEIEEQKKNKYTQ